jgi:hypothetical protein
MNPVSTTRHYPQGIDERIDAAISDCARIVQEVARSLFSSSLFIDSLTAGSLSLSLVSLSRDLDMQESMMILFSSALSYSTVQTFRD